MAKGSGAKDRKAISQRAQRKVAKRKARAGGLTQSVRVPRWTP